MRRFFLVGVSMVLLAGLIAARADEKGPSSGEEQLKAAYAVKKRSFKKKGDEKREILLQAVDAYRRVKDRFPDDRKSCALAAFRIGEIHRTLKERDLAMAAFQRVLAYADQQSPVARALLEIGHLYRRDKNLDMAIEVYSQVSRQCPGEKTYGGRAKLWIAKCHRKKKSYPEARSVLMGLLVDHDGDWQIGLQAYDLLATLYLEEGDPAKAREVLEECRARISSMEDADDGANAALLAKFEKLRSWKKLRNME